MNSDRSEARKREAKRLKGSRKRWPCNGDDHDIKRVSVEQMLEERKALLQRLEAEKPFPGLEAFRREVRTGIERLERRMNESRDPRR